MLLRWYQGWLILELTTQSRASNMENTFNYLCFDNYIEVVLNNQYLKLVLLKFAEECQKY